MMNTMSEKGRGEGDRLNKSRRKSGKYIVPKAWLKKLNVSHYDLGTYLVKSGVVMGGLIKVDVDNKNRRGQFHFLKEWR